MTAATGRLARLAQARLYLIATLSGAELEAPGATLARIAEACAAGVPLLQLRAKGASTAALRALLAQLKARLPADTLLLVNDDLEAVFDADGRPLADGVHLGREDAAALAPTAAAAGTDSSTTRIAQGLSLARDRLGPALLLGTSARTLAAVSAARAAGASYVGFGAMADSPSKPDTVRADPSELRRCLAAHPDFPIFPIGGLRPDDLLRLREAGCRRVALGSAILQARDPSAVVRGCLQRLAD